MDQSRVHDLILFCLATAGQSEDFYSRELGPIHVLKYMYLADVAWAAAHDGETWTGIAWRFHHFGPWDSPAWQEIEPTVRRAGGTVRMVDFAQAEDDRPRYKVGDGGLLRSLAPTVPLEVRRAVKDAVHRFGTDTGGLLEFVYHTRPMLNAAPGEMIDFHYAVSSSAPLLVREPDAPDETLTAKQRKNRREALAGLGAELRSRIAARQARRIVPDPAPRYDDVYRDGVMWLEALAGEAPGPSQGTLELDDSVWHSATRTADVP